MKLTSQLLLVLNLVLAIVLMLHISSVAGNGIRKGLIAEREEASVADHLDQLTRANHALAAQKEAHRLVIAAGRADIRAKEAAHGVLVRWDEDVTKSTADVTARLQEVEAAKADLEGIPGTYDQIVVGLAATMANRAARRDALRSQAGEELATVAKTRASVAQISERFLRLEYDMYLLSSELQAQSELLHMYRYIRPDLQAQVGDNGRPNLAGTVSRATGNVVELDIGSRNGVELYQKLSVIRGGAVVAEINVVEVRGGSALAQVRSTPHASRGIVPQAGDAVVPRQLMMSTDGPGVAGR